MTGRRAESRRRNAEALVDAARRQFLAHGYHAVGIEAIARDADLTTGAIYSIFGAKLGLLHAVVDSRFVPVENAARALGENPRLPAEDVVEAWTRAWYDSATAPDGRGVLRLEAEATALALGDDKAEETFRASAVWPRNTLAGLLTGRRAASGLPDAVLGPGQADRAASVVVALLRGLALQHTLGLDASGVDTWVGAATAAALAAAGEEPGDR
ncbi:TetR/AcrR family transcriptional regulator [Streptomyces sp. JNUCC 64]